MHHTKQRFTFLMILLMTSCLHLSDVFASKQDILGEDLPDNQRHYASDFQTDILNHAFSRLSLKDQITVTLVNKHWALTTRDPYINGVLRDFNAFMNTYKECSASLIQPYTFDMTFKLLNDLRQAQKTLGERRSEEELKEIANIYVKKYHVKIKYFRTKKSVSQGKLPRTVENLFVNLAMMRIYHGTFNLDKANYSFYQLEKEDSIWKQDYFILLMPRGQLAEKFKAVDIHDVKNHAIISAMASELSKVAPVKTAPDYFPELFINKASEAKNHSYWTIASQLYSYALETDPKQDATVYADAGYSSFMVHDCKNTIKYYSQAIKMDPQCAPPVYVLMGMIFVGWGKTKDAADHFKMAIDCDGIQQTLPLEPLQIMEAVFKETGAEERYLQWVTNQHP